MTAVRSAVVVGRARGALAEYEAARLLCDFDSVLVVGAMITRFPHPVDHAVSFHAELFDLWAAERAAGGHPPAGCYWGARYKGRRLGEGVASAAPMRFADCTGGSSGFLAADGVALSALGAERVVLAGVPMMASACHEGDSAHWAEADVYWDTWEAALPRLLGRVKSMSGRTRDALGTPTREWLDGF